MPQLASCVPISAPSVPNIDASSGAVQTRSVAGWKLDSIEDFRSYDWDTDQQTAFTESGGDVCEHCGKECAVLYHVHNDDLGVALLLCPEHVAIACDGWTPPTKAIDRATKQLAKGLQAERADAVQTDAQTLAEKFWRAGGDVTDGVDAIREALSKIDPRDNAYRRDVRARAEYLILRRR